MSIKFNDLIESKEHREELPNENFVYGNEVYDEWMLKDQVSKPRLGYLARKVISFYLGDKYNIEEHRPWNELIIRDHIHSLIQFKILHRLKEYDFDYIDNLFKWMISGMYEVNIPFDQERIDKGFAPIYKRHEEKFTVYNS